MDGFDFLNDDFELNYDSIEEDEDFEYKLNLKKEELDNELEEVKKNPFENEFEKNERAKRNGIKVKTYEEKHKETIETSLSNIGDDGLSINQYEAIEMICRGKTNKEISTALNVTPRIVNSWKKDETFNNVLKKFQQDYMDSYKQQLLSVIPNAIQNLVDILNDIDAPYKDKLTASRTILEMSNIRNGGIKDTNKEVNNLNQAQIVIINPTPPKQDEKPKEVIDLEDVIDV